MKHTVDDNRCFLILMPGCQMLMFFAIDVVLVNSIAQIGDYVERGLFLQI